jgi:hypothetical protein
MKFRIYWILLAVGSLVSVGRCLAWIPNDLLLRQERTVEISVLGQEAKVRIRSRFYNPTTETKLVHSWFPVSAQTTGVHVFVNAEGIEVVEFKDQSRLDALADAAEKNNDVRFFRLAEDPWTRVFRTVEFSVPSEESVEVMWEFSVPIEKQGDFSGIEIFLDDGDTDDLFQIEFSLATIDPIRHFWSPFLAEATVDRSEFGVVALQQRTHFVAPENLRVMWSSVEDPSARFYTDGYEYVAHFRALTPAQYFPKVTIVLDASGSMSDVWLHVQELLRFLLDHQLDRQFRVAISGGEEIEWISGGAESFEENTSEFRQKVLETVSWKNPLGKGNISSVLQQVSQPKTEHLLMVFSDEKEIIAVPDSAPIAVLQFFSSEENASSWQRFAMATRGVVQRAFRSITGTHEAEALLESVESLRQPLFSADVIAKEGEVDIVPLQLLPQSISISPVFIGRIPSTLRSNIGQTWFEWLPRQWAAMNIAEKLEKGVSVHSFSLESLDAILAIARTFGVKSSLFTSETTRAQLQKSLTRSDNIWDVVENLWKTSGLLPVTGIRFVNSVPLWHESDDVWRAFHFRDRVTPEKWVQIAPFSAAQRQLFVLFPEVFAEPFGVAENVEFCTFFRCFSVVDGGRAISLPSDRAFVRDFDPNHWALPFVIDLVSKNILEPELNGKLHLERAVSRGEFVQMLVLDTYGSAFLKTTAAARFSDLGAGDSFFDAVQFLTQKGVIRGYEDSTFRPLQDLSRAEAVKILLAADNIVPLPVDTAVTPMFLDTIGWERPWVEEAARRGIVHGYEDGTFRPNVSLTRAQAAKVIVQSRK